MTNKLNILTNVKLRWKQDRRRAGCSNELLKMVEKLKRLLQATLFPLSSDAFLSIFPITLVVVQNIIRRKKKVKKKRHWNTGEEATLVPISSVALLSISPVLTLNLEMSKFFRMSYFQEANWKKILDWSRIGPTPFSLLSRKTRL